MRNVRNKNSLFEKNKIDWYRKCTEKVEENKAWNYNEMGTNEKEQIKNQDIGGK